MRKAGLRLIIIALCSIGLLLYAAPPKRTQADVQKERTQTNKRIADNQKKLNENTRRTRQSLDNLNNINSQIADQQREISGLQATLDSIDLCIARVNDSIAIVDQKVKTLRRGMAESLRAMRTQRQKMNALSFVFSAPSFTQAMRRIGYLTQLNLWRDNKTKALSRESARLKGLREQLKNLQQQHGRTMSAMSAARQVLDTRRSEANILVAQLKNEGANLQNLLAADRKKAQQLDRELDRIIAAEAEKARRDADKQAADNKKKTEKPAPQQPKQPANAQAKQPATTQKTPSTASSPTPPKTSDNKPQQPAQAPKPTPTPEAKSGFGSMKGRLPMPLGATAKIVGTFGRSQHSELGNIQVDNSGIDLSAPAGTTVKAVYEGVVSSVFEIDGYDTVVILRHGNYLTVYAGISGVCVSKGAHVKTGQQLGRLHTDGAGRSILHFEVRNERQKLNPLEWIAR